MAYHLQVAVRFFSAYYHGSDWPPSPARLFQALVAGGKAAIPPNDWSATHESALQWLERLGSPDIYARPTKIGKAYTIFVPNNSLTDDVSTRTAKSVGPKVLLNHVVGNADVVYVWVVEDAAVALKQVPVLDELASRVRALGWGVDFAAAIALLSEASAPDRTLEHFRPTSSIGVPLRIPNTGSLEDLATSHDAFMRRITTKGLNPYTRPTKFGLTKYTSDRSAVTRRYIAFGLETPYGESFAKDWRQTQVVAAWLRHAAGEALKKEDLAQSWIDSFVLGHSAPEELGHRLSFVPLPSIGHKYSDGAVRRVLIAEPADAGSDAEGLDLLRIKLAGAVLTDASRVDRAVLIRLDDETKVLPFYAGEGRIWETVTPVVLHGHNSERRKLSLRKTNKLLIQAFEESGFPAAILEDIAFQTAPYWSGCEASHKIRVPRHLAQWPRVHVRVEFKRPVQGPVLAGIARHYGIGAFARRREV